MATNPSLFSRHFFIQNDQCSNTSFKQSSPNEKVRKAFIATGIALSLILAISLVAVGIALSHTALIVIGAAVLSICIITLIAFYKQSKKITTKPKEETLQPSTTLILPFQTEPFPFFDQQSSSISSTLPHLKDALMRAFVPLSDIQNIQNQRLRIRDTKTPSLLWGLGPNNQCALLSIQGDISRLAVTVQGTAPYTSMVVNAANEKMLRGGGGTNAALSKVTSSLSWTLSQEGKSKLKEGEIAVGPFSNPDGTNNIANPNGFTYLCQALGPKAYNHNNNPEQCFSLTKQAYSSILNRAKQLKCSLVQLPLLSAGIYAPSLDSLTPEGLSLRDLWIGASQAALLQAMSDFQSKHPHYPILVVVIGNQDLPIR